MLPNPHGLEILIAERRKDLLRAAEEARLARLAAPLRVSRRRPRPRARLAAVLRSLADRLEPAARACEVSSSRIGPRWQEVIR